MRYATVFFVLGVLLIAQAMLVSPAVAWLPAWAGLSFLAVSAAYAGLGPRVFGKSREGRHALWARLLLAPYFLLYQLLWHIVRLIGREPASHRVAPGVYLGRRPLPAELPEDNVRVVDLCVEFPGVSRSDRCRHYSTLPTLDAGVSNVEEFRSLVAEVAADDSPVYIHCASGHGRGAMFAAALLIARGRASNVDEAEAMIRLARPGVRLSPAQRAFVTSAAPEPVP